MSRELDEKDLEQLVRRHRPAPPPPPAGEYARILAAARAETATAARGYLGHLPWALAATVVVALAATFTLGGDKVPAAYSERDMRVEAFLSDTIGEVMANQPEQAVMEPLNGWNALMENGGR